MHHAQHWLTVMQQSNRHCRALEPLQKVTGAVIGIYDPAARITGQYMPGFLAPEIARMDAQELSTQNLFNFDVNLRLVLESSRPTRTDVLSCEESSSSLNCFDY